MNTEEIIVGTGELLNKWRREENSPCVLYVENGLVCCREAVEGDPQRVTDLYVSIWYQENGFTSVQWSTISTALLNQYNREVACRQHLKP